jgi:hypothetical protein
MKTKQELIQDLRNSFDIEEMKIISKQIKNIENEEKKQQQIKKLEAFNKQNDFKRNCIKALIDLGPLNLDQFTNDMQVKKNLKINKSLIEFKDKHKCYFRYNYKCIYVLFSSGFKHEELTVQKFDYSQNKLIQLNYEEALKENNIPLLDISLKQLQENIKNIENEVEKLKKSIQEYENEMQKNEASFLSSNGFLKSYNFRSLIEYSNNY